LIDETQKALKTEIARFQNGLVGRRKSMKTIQKQQANVKG
tara:strand:+ start:387 stop:506 length:120 start_codon:yes stop_codon:yes gene_type:complete